VQRLEAEEHLEEARTRLRNAFEHAPIGMALVAADGRWISANPRCAGSRATRRTSCSAARSPTSPIPRTSTPTPPRGAGPGGRAGLLRARQALRAPHGRAVSGCG
jgi:hypothetical protein